MLPRCLLCQGTTCEPWAEATDAEYLTIPDRFTFYRCRDCDVLFIDPVPRERLAEIYPSNYYSFVPPKRLLVHRIKQWLDRRLFRGLLAQLPGESLAVLDVGGGSGWQLDRLKELDPRVRLTQVVDLDRQAAATAEAHGHRYFCGIIEEFATEERFDLVLLLNLIEHVYDPAGVLAKVARLLRPHGLALVQTPNYRSLDARLFRHGNWAGYHCPRHWVLFDRDSFLRTAGRCGLEARTFAYTQGAHFWAESVLFALARRKLVSITRERPAVYHPLYAPLSGLFAGFDLVRARLGGRPSQMFVVLGRAGDRAG